MHYSSIAILFIRFIDECFYQKIKKMTTLAFLKNPSFSGRTKKEILCAEKCRFCFNRNQFKFQFFLDNISPFLSFLSLSLPPSYSLPLSLSLFFELLLTVFSSRERKERKKSTKSFQIAKRTKLIQRQSFSFFIF